VVLLFLVVLVAVVGVLLIGGGFTLASMLTATAVIVIGWSAGAFLPRRREQ
jgi:hypothetical protein